MLEKILLATAATFSLNLFLGVYIPSAPQSAIESSPLQTPQHSPSLPHDVYSLNVSPKINRAEP